VASQTAIATFAERRIRRNAHTATRMARATPRSRSMIVPGITRPMLAMVSHQTGDQLAYSGAILLRAVASPGEFGIRFRCRDRRRPAFDGLLDRIRQCLGAVWGDSGGGGIPGGCLEQPTGRTGDDRPPAQDGLNGGVAERFIQAGGDDDDVARCDHVPDARAEAMEAHLLLQVAALD